MLLKLTTVVFNVLQKYPGNVTVMLPTGYGIITWAFPALFIIYQNPGKKLQGICYQIITNQVLFLL